MKPWRAVHEWAGRHPFEIDAIVAAAIAVASVVTLAVASVEGSERSPDLFGYVLAGIVPLVLAYRRVRPLATIVIVTIGTVAFWILDYPAGLDLVLLIAFYSATRHGADRRRVWWVVGACLLTVTGVAIIGVIAPVEDLPAIAIVGLPAIHGIAAVLGEVFYQRGQRIAQLEQRAAALEAEVEAKAKLAALDERARIAREMHDVVAHGMSVVVVQASAARRLVRSDPDRADEALANIESTGRESLAEMRRALGVLRNPDLEAELGPQPSLADFRTLVQRAVDAGVEASIKIHGEPRSAPAGLELAAYRVLQEALTNVVQHAGRPVRAEVGVTFEPDAILVEVSDDGIGAAASADTAGSGHGLIGMRERVELYGGTLAAGPSAGGGFHVRATFPLEPVAEASGPTAIELAETTP